MQSSRNVFRSCSRRRILNVNSSFIKHISNVALRSTSATLRPNDTRSASSSTSSFNQRQDNADDDYLSPSSPVPPKPGHPDYPSRPAMIPYPSRPPIRYTDLPNTVVQPPYAKTGHVIQHAVQDILVHTQEESIHKMRCAAQLARRMLDYACSLVDVGVTTDDLDYAVHQKIIGTRMNNTETISTNQPQHAYPSPLNYSGFPKSLCTSVNEVICHGIPDSRPLQYGDVISLDVSCYIQGVHGDNCATVIVGDYCKDDDNHGRPTKKNRVSDDTTVASCDWRGVPFQVEFENPQEEARIKAARRLVHATREALYAGIEVCQPGGCLSSVGNAIHSVADAYGYETVQKYRGHGISHEFHCPPFVKHYRNRDNIPLVPGMIFTIEPMLTEGSWDCREWDDDWTVVTLDGGLSAQFEHTVLITDTGVEILTLP